MAQSAGTRADVVLKWAREICDPEIRRWIAALGGHMGEVASYQIGWTGGSGPSERHTGKYVRSALTLLCTRAVGGDAARAAPAAAAMEMVHNLSLLYDDVLDGDTVRRHRASAWQVFGPASATRAADALLVVAFEELSGVRDGPQIAEDASAAVLDTLIQLAVGESLDVLFEGRSRVEPAECLEMVSGKTASLFACACRLGALYGRAGTADTARFAAFGHDLGMAFQLVDDLLAIWGDPRLTGKQVFGDLHARKLSVPVVAALASDTPAARELAIRYARPPGNDPDGEGAGLAQLVEEAGGRQWTQKRASAYCGAAHQWLAELRGRTGAAHGPQAQAVADLEAVCDLIVARSP
ncbi:polyprenyl synthetase family protein [Streptomyces sp. NPDC088789]|uniref:polyprenyl synthetase family protein n=1 Tax=Streptomyces sp. NPDC088789 TaxID=3365899 RepID=UPI003805B289